MFHGHLWLANGAIGIEAFVHDGRQYTYFGLFPSIIRMPILLLTSSLDAQLTVPYMLAAWLLTALFVSLLLWRVRLLIRGPVAMGRAEATAFGVLIATILVGSVFTVLASLPYVFAEDLAWSICLTVGSLFALLGVLERPSRGRVWVAGALILCANLDRLTTGWACVVGAVLVAAWFGLGRGGEQNRRWWVPILAAGLIPLLVGCFVNYLKFGVPFGLPVVDQVWTIVNAYRRKFLAANHNSEEGIAFIPSDALAYLRLDGLRFTSVFPFVTLPAGPATAVSGVLFDRRYRTASMPSSMPCCSCSAAGEWSPPSDPGPSVGSPSPASPCWPPVRPGPPCCCGATSPPGTWPTSCPSWSWPARWRWPTSGAGWRVGPGGSGSGSLRSSRWSPCSPSSPTSASPSCPTRSGRPTQAYNFVETQKSISDITGHPSATRRSTGGAGCRRGRRRASSTSSATATASTSPTGRTTRPSQPGVHPRRRGWRSSAATPSSAPSRSRPTISYPAASQWMPMLHVGPNTVSARITPSRFPGKVQFSLTLIPRVGKITYGLPTLIPLGSTDKVVVVTDPVKHLVEVTIEGLGPTFLTQTVHTVEPVSVTPGVTLPGLATGPVLGGCHGQDAPAGAVPEPDRLTGRAAGATG